MPEAQFVVQWPDGGQESCYSPSLVVHDHLRAGSSYSVTDFVARTEAAMQEASDRVRAKYGMACTSAMATAAFVRARAADQPDSQYGRVTVLSIHPPLPGASS